MIIQATNTKAGPQLARAMIYDGKLSKEGSPTSWYTKVQKIKKQPTVALVRQMIVALIQSAGWRIEVTEDAPEGAEKLIKDTVFPHRFHLIRRALLGCMDFGWCPFEVLYKMTPNNQLGVKKFKHLIQDCTEIFADKKSGDFRGFYQETREEGKPVKIMGQYAQLFNFDVEGDYHYGYATMKNIEAPYDNYVKVDEAAARYDNKIAGANWQIHYPEGTTLIEGEEVDNYVVAQRLYQAIKASSGIIVPSTVKEYIEELSEKSEFAWKIELIEAKGSSKANFGDRQSYLDKLFVRGLGFPERTILEGEHGTKAEAGEHGDFALTGVELRHEELLISLNEQTINYLLKTNFGEQFENTVTICPNPLTDSDKAIMAKIYDAIIADPELLRQEMTKIDHSALREKLNVPVDEDDDVEIEDVEPQEPGEIQQELSSLLPTVFK